MSSELRTFSVEGGVTCPDVQDSQRTGGSDNNNTVSLAQVSGRDKDKEEPCWPQRDMKELMELYDVPPLQAEGG